MENAKKQERFHMAQKYIEILSDSFPSSSSDDLLETSSDASSDSGTRQKQKNHLTYFIEVNPYLHELCFNLISLMEMTQWTQYWI